MHAGKIGFFKDETKSDPIVEFFGLLAKIYLFTLCSETEYIPKLHDSIDVWQQSVAKKVTCTQIKRFKHKTTYACTMVKPLQIVLIAASASNIPRCA